MDKIEKDFQKIFDITLGNTDPEPPFEWVETAFTPGTLFSEAYEDFSHARENLCARFPIEEDDDDDLERFMNGLMKLETDFGRRMFFSGFRYASMGREK